MKRYSKDKIITLEKFLIENNKILNNQLKINNKRLKKIENIKKYITNNELFFEIDKKEINLKNFNKN